MLLGDLKGGLNKVNTEILKAAGVDANSAFAHRQFGDLMMSFHQHAKQTFADLEASSTLHALAGVVPVTAEVTVRNSCGRWQYFSIELSLCGNVIDTFYICLLVIVTAVELV